jgi:hypothetical protein
MIDGLSCSFPASCLITSGWRYSTGYHQYQQYPNYYISTDAGLVYQDGSSGRVRLISCAFPMDTRITCFWMWTSREPASLTRT